MVLRDIEDIKIHILTYKDVVRHELVQKIIRAYEKEEQRKEATKNAREKKRYD